MSLKKIYPLSKEQTEYLFYSTARQNWAHGPVRSGKNFVINLRVATALKKEPVGAEDSDVIFAGKDKKTVYRIFLKDLFKLVGEGNYSYNRAEGFGRIFNRDFYVVGYSDADSHEKISGATVGLAYVTEGIYGHEDFHRQLMARLSIDGAMLFGDTNPSGPYHWLWKQVINNQEKLACGDVRAFPFNFDSNLSQSEEYKEALKRDFGPGSLWYQRMIEGKWVMADGLVYQSFQPARNTCRVDQLPTDFEDLFVSVDYGTNNPFAALMIGKSDGKYWVIDEYYHTGRNDGQKTNLQYAEELAKFTFRRDVSKIYCDPSAAAFKVEIQNFDAFLSRGVFPQDANNSVIDGIQVVDRFLLKGDLIICDRCTNTLEEISGYVWDSRAAQRGEDKPKKENDHAMDALRYGIYTHSQGYDAFAGWA